MQQAQVHSFCSVLLEVLLSQETMAPATTSVAITAVSALASSKPNVGPYLATPLGQWSAWTALGMHLHPITFLYSSPKSFVSLS